MSAEAEQPTLAATPTIPAVMNEGEDKKKKKPSNVASADSNSLLPSPPTASLPTNDGLMDTACSSVSTASSWVSEEHEGRSLSPSASTSGIVTLSSSEQLVANPFPTHGSSVPANGVVESESAETIANQAEPLLAVSNDQQPLSMGNSSPKAAAPATAAAPAAAAPAAAVADLETQKVEVEFENQADPDQSVFMTKTIELKPRLGIIPFKWLDPLCKPLRSIVSQNRRRYIDDVNNVNLDLTYITDRIIAMGYPSHETESLYRNTMLSTVYFLQLFHDNHFMVFNLRGEYIYDAKNFQYRVSAYEMTDHHPPRLELMGPFCEEMHAYLEADEENVVAVHCKAGKGRTGVMICAYLTYIRLYASARQCMDYYSIVRTHNNKGVTIPSQRRYIYYFEHILNNDLTYQPYQCELVGIYIEQPPQNGRFSNMNGLQITVSSGDVEMYSSAPMIISKETLEEENELIEEHPNFQGDDSYDFHHRQPHAPGKIFSRRCFGWTLPEDQRIFLEGDICVRINRTSTPAADRSKKSSIKTKKLGHIWFNTFFSCPHYCGVPYVHGDEAYPYPEDGTTIARKVSGDDSDEPTTNGEDLPTCSKNIKKTKKNSCKYEVAEPPGLELHCPSESVAAIHRNSLEPPRVSIRKLLEKAHEKNLVSDDYNERRKAAQGSGEPIPLAPVGRPNASGPFCLLRNGDEHGAAYRAIEVDKVCKNNNVPPGFKVIIVTRCIDRCQQKEVDLSETLLQQIRHSQRFYEAQKRQEMHQKIEHKVRKGIEAAAAAAAKKEATNKIKEFFRKSKISDEVMRHEIQIAMKNYLFPHRPDTLPPERYFLCPDICHPAASAVQPETKEEDDDANRTITSCSSSYFRPAEDIFERLMAEEDESPDVEEDSE